MAKHIKNYTCENCGNTFKCEILDEPHIPVRFCVVCGEESEFDEVSYGYQRYDEDEDTSDEE